MFRDRPPLQDVQVLILYVLNCLWLLSMSLESLTGRVVGEEASRPHKDNTYLKRGVVKYAVGFKSNIFLSPMQIIIQYTVVK